MYAVTKTIHLEVVGDISFEALIAAFKRFIARRGRCSNLYSDNGAAFVRANNALIKKCQSVIRESPHISTQWHFIPPGSPHFGGIWETGVTSMKYHLKQVIGETTSPLIPLSNEINPLTFRHFLKGEALIAPLQTTVENISVTN